MAAGPGKRHRAAGCLGGTRPPPLIRCIVSSSWGAEANWGVEWLCAGGKPSGYGPLPLKNPPPLGWQVTSERAAIAWGRMLAVSIHHKF